MGTNEREKTNGFMQRTMLHEYKIFELCVNRETKRINQKIGSLSQHVDVVVGGGGVVIRWKRKFGRVSVILVDFLLFSLIHSVIAMVQCLFA